MRKRKRLIRPLLLMALLVLISVPTVLAKPPSNWFTPNYNAILTGDIQGSGGVEVAGGKTVFKEIHSDVRYNNYPLTFSTSFEGNAGVHIGYLYISTPKGSDRLLREFRYTYGPEGQFEDYYQLHGFGNIVGDDSKGWFTLTSVGEYTISVSGPSTGWQWVEIWRGTPQFVMSGEKLP